MKKFFFLLLIYFFFFSCGQWLNAMATCEPCSVHKASRWRQRGARSRWRLQMLVSVVRCRKTTLQLKHRARSETHQGLFKWCAQRPLPCLHGLQGLRQGLACSFVRNLIRVIKNLYDKATSAFLFNSSIRDWFRTAVGVRQGCLLSPDLFNIFLERIMTDASEDHEGTAGIVRKENGISE